MAASQAKDKAALFDSNFFIHFSDKKAKHIQILRGKKQRYVTKKGRGDEGTPEWHITIQICESE